MRTLIWIVVLVSIVAGVGVLVVPNFGSRVETGLEDIRNEISVITSLETNVAVAKKEVSKKRVDIEEYQHKINLNQLDVNELAGKIEGLKDKLKAEQSYVLTDHKLLQKHDKEDTIEIYGDSFTYDEVNEDARVRLGKCEVLERDINDTITRVESLSIAISNAKDNISQAIGFVNQNEVQIADFESKIRSKKIAIETTNIAKALEVDLMNSNDGLVTAMNTLKKIDRDFDAQLMAGNSAALSTSGRVINHEKKQGKEDVSIKVSEYLLKANLISEISSASTTPALAIPVPVVSDSAVPVPVSIN